MEESFFYRNGKISYNIRGNGSVIVLIHGYLESKEVWNNFAERLSEKFRVICVDLPGHGNSDVYGDTHTMEFMATALKALLDSIRVEKACLVGHSLGGYVTLAFLELFPGHLSCYSLFHSHPYPDSPEATDKRKREIELVKKGKKGLMYPDNVEKMFAVSNLEKFHDALERLKRIASGIPAGGIIAVLNGMIERPSRLKQMEEGRVPCLWILGLMDNYIPCELIREKVKLPDNAELVVLEESGHVGFIEEEEESLRILIKFVQARG